MNKFEKDGLIVTSTMLLILIFCSFLTFIALKTGF
jgi:hypothetical protein